MTGDRRLRVCAPALAGLLWLAACQGGAPSPSPGPSGAPAALQAADQKLFKGDYDGAEADYRDLLKSGTPGAGAHLALLLGYESRFREAVAEAESAAAAHSDSATLARLTRALDWSEDVNGALAAGARATQAKPVDPLAHIFYAEALADAGAYDQSQRELKAAEAMNPRDAYTRSELNREWANYYRDRHNPQQELNFTQLSLKDQPGFPERQLELARYQFLNNRGDLAENLLAGIQKSFPNSYPVLLAAADAAFLGADVDVAGSFYQAAAQLNPGGAAAALGRAELAVAVKRDFAGAHDLLLATLKKNPAAGDVYLYLRYLDLLVLKTDPDQELKPIAQPPTQLDAARKDALDRVNAYRQPLGLSPLVADATLAEGAEAHAYYFLFNFGQPSESGLGVHAEDPSLPGFTGENPLVRDRHFGYGGNRGGEVINHVFTPRANVQSWVDSVYHRYPIIGRETHIEGYGEAQVGIISVSVMDFGIGAPGSGEAIVYPAAGQKDVPAAFAGNEVPDPLPQGGSYPTGYPVTLAVGGGDTLEVTSGRLLAPDGKEVASYSLAPGQRSLAANEWALLAKSPLTPGATYTAEVIGKLNGKDYSKRWSFTVASR